MSLSNRTSSLAYRSATVLLLLGILTMGATVLPSSSLDGKDKKTTAIAGKGNKHDEGSLAAPATDLGNKRTETEAIPANAVSSSLVLADTEDEDSPQDRPFVIRPAATKTTSLDKDTITSPENEFDSESVLPPSMAWKYLTDTEEREHNVDTFTVAQEEVSQETNAPSSAMPKKLLNRVKGFFTRKNGGFEQVAPSSDSEGSVTVADDSEGSPSSIQLDFAHTNNVAQDDGNSIIKPALKKSPNEDVVGVFNRISRFITKSSGGGDSSSVEVSPSYKSLHTNQVQQELSVELAADESVSSFANNERFDLTDKSVSSFVPNGERFDSAEALESSPSKSIIDNNDENNYPVQSLLDRFMGFFTNFATLSARSPSSYKQNKDNEDSNIEYEDPLLGIDLTEDSLSEHVHVLTKPAPININADTEVPSKSLGKRASRIKLSKTREGESKQTESIQQGSVLHSGYPLSKSDHGSVEKVDLSLPAKSFLNHGHHSRMLSFASTPVDVTPSDLGDDDSFGAFGIAMTDNVLVVGSAWNDEFDQDAGAIYIYEKDLSGNWGLEEKLKGTTSSDYFGTHVAISPSGNTIFATSTNEDSSGCTSQQVQVHIIQKQMNGSWTEIATPETPNCEDMNVNFDINSLAAFSDDAFLIGSAGGNSFSGIVYFVEKDTSSGNWDTTQWTTIQDSAGFFFGYYLSLSENTVIIGGGGQSVYIFEFESGVWNQKFSDTNPDADSSFGVAAVSISESVAVVSYTSPSSSRYVRVFEKDSGGVWSYTNQQLQPSDQGSDGDCFGCKLAVSENFIFVGAYVHDDPASNAGAVYLYEQIDNTWTQIEKMSPPAVLGATGALFGNGVAMSGNTVAIGASTVLDSYKGAMFIYTFESGNPSDTPSSAPSSQPSQTPSSEPSSEPSSQPSLDPSTQPSSLPSSQPSLQPTLVPSESPSSMPSSEPSDAPSCTPSQSPTPQQFINLFYPDWSPGSFNQGCINDGKQEAYMEANVATYMFSTLDACCSAFFAWNYNACMGDLDNTCARALWYPDWEGANTGCKRDGNEPLYMTHNVMIYLYSTKRECCDEHYSWNLECMDGSVGNTGRKYYPDWTGDDICKNDGEGPTHMTLNPSTWLHDTLSECCAEHYKWKMDECMGLEEVDGTGLYYPDWTGDDEACLNDRNEPQYMVQNPSSWMFSTLDECCEKHYSYNLATCAGASASTGTAKFWIDWSDKKCVQDCVGPSPCGGVAESWDTKYDTKAECCEENMSYNRRECINAD